MACQVSSPQVGLSVYKNDFKTRISTGSFSPKPNRLRRNRPHPHQDFLLPSHINDGIELQKRVRRAVREYLDEIYSSRGNSRLSNRPPPQFLPPRDDEDLKSREILTPKTSEKVYRPYPYYREVPSQLQLGVLGKSTFDYERPSTTVANERSPPNHLQGETKRERSIRIREEIDKKARAPTPSPQPKKWQRISSAVPPQKKPFIAKPPQPKRAYSAPPASKGYSHYKQSTKENSSDMHKPVQDKLRAWADTANDYEKQVVYNLLSQASKPRDGVPTTPPSPQEAYHMLLKAKRVPMEQGPPVVHDESGDRRSSWSPYFNDLRRQQTKQRGLNSAPVKPMLGLVPNATQYPHRDQRAFRLKGQDSRVMGNPEEERELKEYMNRVARVTQKQWRTPEKKFLIAPMRSYPVKKGSMPKDYKCDVSFFQSVRAPFKSHFVIHPDFTSETFIQKKRADQMVSHIQY